MKREFLQNLKIGDQALTKEVVDLIMKENGKDIEAAIEALKGERGYLFESATLPAIRTINNYSVVSLARRIGSRICSARSSVGSSTVRGSTIV